MLRMRHLLRFLPIAVALSACASVNTQEEPGTGVDPISARQAPLRALPETADEFLEDAPGIYVVVDLDTNLLRLMDGHRKLWEAPVGTGTGLRLKGDDGDWHFTTPEGVFQIQYKEEVPVWYLPDWYFVEKGLPIPADDAPERKVEGQLGIAAVYIGREIAIHGTNHPELLGQRVSHGCIRLHNDFALRLFHNVQVGTPVVVVGGEDLEEIDAADVPTPSRVRKPPEPDPFGGVSTEALLTRLDAELDEADTTNSWVRITSRLITRGLKDDAVALRGVLSRAGSASSRDRNREYATFLADAFTRGGLRAVVSLARIDEEERKLAAEAIVGATVALYPGFLNDPLAPWPTRRVPNLRLGPDGKAGWDALAEAELALRETRGADSRVGAAR